MRTRQRPCVEFRSCSVFSRARAACTPAARSTGRQTSNFGACPGAEAFHPQVFLIALQLQCAHLNLHEPSSGPIRLLESKDSISQQARPLRWSEEDPLPRITLGTLADAQRPQPAEPPPTSSRVCAPTVSCTRSSFSSRCEQDEQMSAPHSTSTSSSGVSVRQVLRPCS